MFLKKLISKIGIVFKFLRRAIQLRIQLLPLDKKLPFKGKLAPSGYFQFYLKKNTILALSKLKQRNLDKEN